MWGKSQNFPHIFPTSHNYLAKSFSEAADFFDLLWIFYKV